MPASFCFGYQVTFESLLTAAYVWPTIKTMRQIRKAKWNNKLTSTSDKTGIAHLPAEIIEFINSHLLDVVFEGAKNRWPVKEACHCNWMEALGDNMPEALENLYNDFMTERLLAAENDLRDKQAVLDIDTHHAREAVSAAKATVDQDPSEINSAKLLRLEQKLKSLEANWYVIESDCELEYNHDIKMNQSYFRRMNIEFRQSPAFFHYKDTISASRYSACPTCPNDRFIAFETLCHGSSGRPLGTRYDSSKDVLAIRTFLSDHELVKVYGSEGNADQFVNKEVDELFAVIGQEGSAIIPSRALESATIHFDPSMFDPKRSAAGSEEMIYLAKNFRLEARCPDEVREEAQFMVNDQQANFEDVLDDMIDDCGTLIPRWIMVDRKTLDRNSIEYTGIRPAPPVPDEEDSQ